MAELAGHLDLTVSQARDQFRALSGFTLPPRVVNHDERWVDVPLRGDVGQWAKSTARDIAGRAALKGGQERKLAGILEGAGEIAQRATDASMGLLLFPDIWEPVRAFVRFCPVDLAGADGEAAWPALRDCPTSQRPPTSPRSPPRPGPATASGSGRSPARAASGRWASSLPTCECSAGTTPA